MLGQTKHKSLIKILLILAILIVSIVVLYKPHFKIKFGGYDNLEWYNEAQERDTLEKIIDYKYYSGRYGPSAFFNPIQLFIWRYMTTHYEKSPFPYHLLSTLIHIINTIIVFFILRMFIKSNFFSFVATLSFAIYYLNFRTIEWIAAAITTGLATFFILSTFFLAIKYFQTKKRCFLILSLLIFFLGTFTKEYVVFTIPLLLAYYLIIQRKKVLKFVETDPFVLPYFMLSLPIILITLAKLNNSAIVNRWGGTNFGIHMFYRFIDFINYLITAIPVSFNIKMAIAMFILFSFPLLIYYGLRDKNLLFLVVWLIVFISIYIYSNFRNIYTLARYLYLPSIAWFGLLYYIAANIKNIKMKIVTSFCLINYTIIFNLFLILR